MSASEIASSNLWALSEPENSADKQDTDTSDIQVQSRHKDLREGVLMFRVMLVWICDTIIVTHSTKGAHHSSNYFNFLVKYMACTSHGLVI